MSIWKKIRQMFILNKIPRKYWELSRDKWELIVALTKAGVLFDTLYGFSNVNVVSRCGYCELFEPKFFIPCRRCNLRKKKICNYSIRSSSFPFWQYIKEMRSYNNKAALPYAEQILKAIMEDEVNVIEDEEMIDQKDKRII